MVTWSHNDDAEKVHITVLGAAGNIGRRHIAHISRDPHCVLHSIIDSSATCEELAKHYCVKHFSNWDTLVRSGEPLPDGVVIATPSALHIAQAIPVVQLGIHVLVEKPLCNEAWEAMPLLEASKESQAGTILVGFHRRFNPYVVQLKKALDGQTDLGVNPIGSVVGINALWCTRKPVSYFEEASWRKSHQGGGGVILTNLSHELDLMRYLFGDITRVFAETGKKTRAYDVEETVAITLKFDSGIVGTMLISDAALTPYFFESATGENSELAKHYETVYNIFGTAGTLSFPNLDYWSNHEKSQGRPGDWTDTLMKDTASKNRIVPEDQHQAPFADRLSHWVRVIQRKERVNCTLEDGIKNVKLLDAILKSIKNEEAIVLNNNLDVSA